MQFPVRRMFKWSPCVTPVNTTWLCAWHTSSWPPTAQQKDTVRLQGKVWCSYMQTFRMKSPPKWDHQDVIQSFGVRVVAAAVRRVLCREQLPAGNGICTSCPWGPFEFVSMPLSRTSLILSLQQASYEMKMTEHSWKSYIYIRMRTSISDNTHHIKKATDVYNIFWWK